MSVSIQRFNVNQSLDPFGTRHDFIFINSNPSKRLIFTISTEVKRLDPRPYQTTYEANAE